MYYAIDHDAAAELNDVDVVAVVVLERGGGGAGGGAGVT